ncbi:hypothetical protein G6N74_13030 [Mesorhizobium sp. CGMCC 1.15528]|uniref:DUF4261 domain-containing protein n=1 Tax=Mesorhizobium zhangyense TaxID=1776730 RepID=A0A7C9VCB0_9HYPH|nr:hypothetical protein [Mesorhizobium zhangyense]NGN41989.1 hypothetical protein [Mesorhizobium zhangyense]
MSLEDKIILCIPGPWEDQRAFVRAVAEASRPDGDYLVTGVIMTHGPNKKAFDFEFCDRDERMAEAFASAGIATRIRDDFLDEIEAHKSVVYLKSTELQSLETAEAIAKAASHLIKAGGIGVKVETAGKAFTASQWFEEMETVSVSLYWLMVLDSVTDDTTIYSCGMRNFGLSDSIVSDEGLQLSVPLLRDFNKYQLYQQPVLSAGQTFRREEGGPTYRLSIEENQPDRHMDIYSNPFGMWRLSRVGPENRT